MAPNSLGTPRPTLGLAAQSAGQGGLGVRGETEEKLPSVLQLQPPQLRPVELEVLSGSRTDLHGHRGSGGADKGLPSNHQMHPAECPLPGLEETQVLIFACCHLLRCFCCGWQEGTVSFVEHQEACILR